MSQHSDDCCETFFNVVARLCRHFHVFNIGPQLFTFIKSLFFRNHPFLFHIYFVANNKNRSRVRIIVPNEIPEILKFIKRLSISDIKHDDKSISELDICISHHTEVFHTRRV